MRSFVEQALQKLFTFSTLPLSEKFIWLEAVVYLVLARLTLWILPYRLVERGTRRLRSWMWRPVVSSEVAQVAPIVVSAARYVPRATCLAQALTAQIMLARRGAPSEIKFGVRTTHEAGFEAHAWLESEGRILIGGSEGRWVQLPIGNGNGPRR
jgi:hypothetical protein